MRRQVRRDEEGGSRRVGSSLPTAHSRPRHVAGMRREVRGDEGRLGSGGRREGMRREAAEGLAAPYPLPIPGPARSGDKPARYGPGT